MECFDENSLYGLFIRVIKLHYLKIHHLLESLDIYPGQPPLLISLHKKDGQSQAELAKKIKVKPATLTIMLKRIEKAGLIEKRQDEQDQRVQRVYLTEKGRKTCEKLKDILKCIESECFKDFTPEERENLNVLLRKIAGNLESSFKK
ncbi:MarR family winged helix-turn-helix transcriptional regulator [Thermovenabulum sp.]|uniref:MarR family winged helix-turn-helix transcriptional regulator n=1 Tax=Thermovenabulum sp. TaxID=3100335 RepID=UPI003C7C991C